jgi:hypothetical protein
VAVLDQAEWELRTCSMHMDRAKSFFEYGGTDCQTRNALEDARTAVTRFSARIAEAQRKGSLVSDASEPRILKYVNLLRWSTTHH